MSEENEWADEIRDSIRRQLESIVTEEMRRLSMDATALEKAVKDIDLYTVIGDNLKSIVANEIGNQLRVYASMASLMDKAFENVWTEQLQGAMEDRVRRKIADFIDKKVKIGLKFDVM